jgi:hypothetical protein
MAATGTPVLRIAARGVVAALGVAIAIVLAAGLLVSASVVHPADHLDNRWHGWLSDA